MTRRELVKAAIQHKNTPRVPYCIQLTKEAWEAVKPLAGDKDVEGFLDNDVATVGPPWWWWHDLASDWGGMDAPTSPAKVRATAITPISSTASRGCETKATSTSSC